MQYGNQYQQPQQGRNIGGVPIDTYDQSTFNPGLPNQNDAVPNVMQTQFLAQGGFQLYQAALGFFRLRLQERAARGGLYTYTYNLISQNRFNNALFAEWAQDVATMVEFLLATDPHNNPIQHVPQKVADIMYRSLYAAMAGQIPQLANESLANDPMAAQQLNDAASRLGGLKNDMHQWRMRQQQPQYSQQQQQQYGQQQHPQYGGSQQLPPIGQAYRTNGQYGQSPNQHLSQAGVSQMAALQPSTHQFNSAPASGGSAGMSYGAGEPEPQITTQTHQQKPLQPVESYGLELPSAAASMAPPPAQSYQVIEEVPTDLPIPLSADDVVMNPWAYVPAGVEINPDRPYDVIYSPGGIETRPAMDVDWVITKSDARPYSQVMDSVRGMRWLTRFPDGVVQERFVEFTMEMDYRKHEISTDLRNAAKRDNGLLVITEQPISRHLEGTSTLEILKEHPTENIGESSPIKLPLCIAGSSPRENENEARTMVITELGITPGEVIPAHEYSTARFHPMTLTDTAFNRLLEVSEFKDLTSVAKELTRMVDMGELSLREFNFVNDRLTGAVNGFLGDRLSLEARISDFSTDAPELPDFLINEYGNAYAGFLTQATPWILGQYFCMQSDDEGNVGIKDFGINLQTGWELRELTDANIGDEAQLVSVVTHKAIENAIKGMLTRNQGEVRNTHRMFMVTVDGHYLEVMRGYLRKDVFLIKRIS